LKDISVSPSNWCGDRAEKPGKVTFGSNKGFFLITRRKININYYSQSSKIFGFGWGAVPRQAKRCLQVRLVRAASVLFPSLFLSSSRRSLSLWPGKAMQPAVAGVDAGAAAGLSWGALPLRLLLRLPLWLLAALLCSALLCFAAGWCLLVAALPNHPALSCPPSPHYCKR
jgi:hypothetical protein